MTRTSRSFPKKYRKAVFLDRDGVINKEVDHLVDVKKIRIIPNTARALQKIHKKGYLAIVVGNQSVVAYGMASEEKVEAINDEIARRLGRSGGVIDAWYYCPHHPSGVVPRYAIRCLCRKPGTGMIRRAAKEFNIDLGESFLVGDKTSDILAGKRAGLKTILVRTGYAGADKQYVAVSDFIARNLFQAVSLIS